MDGFFPMLAPRPLPPGVERVGTVKYVQLRGDGAAPRLNTHINRYYENGVVNPTRTKTHATGVREVEERLVLSPVKGSFNKTVPGDRLTRLGLDM